MAKKNVNPEISKITNLINSKYEDCEEIFQEMLKRIKPFRNIKGDIPIELLEKLIYKYELKYAIMVNYICPIFVENTVPMYSASIRSTKTREMLPTIYGTSIYETLCKICLYYYMEITIKESIGLKDWRLKYES